MSTSPDQLPQKGWFHELYGAPLLTVIRGNGGAYRKLDQELTQIETDRTQQLRLLPQIETQFQELSQAEVMLKSSLAQNKDDIAVAQQLLRQAQKRLEEVEFNSPFSTTPRVPTPGRILDVAIGRIPIIGAIYTSYQVASYYEERKQALRVHKIETKAVRAIEEFGMEVQQRVNDNADASRKAAQQLEAQRKLVGGLTALSQSTLEKRNIL